MSNTRVLSNVMVPMRDGVLLATDIYLPSSADSTWPVIMERTPYNKAGPSRSEVSLTDPSPRSRADVARAFAGQGFAVVMQDCRGRFGSGGVFTKYLSEAEDGVDTLAWLVQQSWCNGRVGTMGLSYGAHTQSALACLNPPGLACMFMDSGGFSSAFHGGIRRGGAYELKQATWAYRHALLSPEVARDPQRLQALQNEDIEQWFRNMPWYPGHSPLRHSPEYESYLFELWQHGRFDAYWQRPGLFAEGYYDDFPDVPVAIMGSWYDPYVRTCLNNFQGLAGRKQSAMQLIMGPWTHGNRSCSHAGNVDFGPDAVLDGNLADDYFAMRLAWFRRWLQDVPAGLGAGAVVGAGAAVGAALGAETALSSESALSAETALSAEVPDSGSRSVWYFRMGGGSGKRNTDGRLAHGGQWVHTDQWPPRDVVEQRLMLSVDGSAAFESPRQSAAATPNDGSPVVTDDTLTYREFVFDPRDPVPTVGGALTSGEPVMQGGAFDQRSRAGKFGLDDSPDSRPLADRADVLVFQTQPLTEDLVVTGAVTAELWVSSDQPDTDFTVKLMDVYPPSEDYPEGFAMNITDGIFRVRYREGFDREVMMQPGHVYKIVIEPFATSNRFCKGHRLRVDISSSNFPHFDVNPNTGAPEGSAGERRVARNRLYCSPRHPSHLKMGTEDILFSHILRELPE